jgi:diacylglycerol kinase family enzyme
LIVGAAAARLATVRERELVSAVESAIRRRGLTRLEIRSIDAPGGGAGLAREAVAGGAAIVIAAGGDGTIREVAGSLAGTGVPLGVVPLGTGNLFASAVGIRRIGSALSVLATGSARCVDVGWLSLAAQPARQPFLVASGSGLDAMVIGATRGQAKRRWGIAAYFVTAARTVRRVQPRPTRIVVDGRAYELESTVVLVVNAGDLVPGLVRPRIPIRPDDGLLDVFVVRSAGVLGTLGGAVDLLGLADEDELVRGLATIRGVRLRGREVQVEVDSKEPVEADGDIVGSGTFTATVEASSLAVLSGD